MIYLAWAAFILAFLITAIVVLIVLGGTRDMNEESLDAVCEGALIRELSDLDFVEVRK